MGWNEKTGQDEWGYESNADHFHRMEGLRGSNRQNNSSGSNIETKIIVGLITLPFKILKALYRFFR